ELEPSRNVERSAEIDRAQAIRIAWRRVVISPGDASFSEFHELTSAYLRSVARRILRHDEDVSDVLQYTYQCLVELSRAADALDMEDPLQMAAQIAGREATRIRKVRARERAKYKTIAAAGI